MWQFFQRFTDAWQTFFGNALIKYVFNGFITPAATNAGGPMLGLVADGARTTAEVMMSTSGSNVFGNVTGMFNQGLAGTNRPVT